ncbi:MAG: hypothetical protein WBX15_20075 [Thermoanaerobaculia bacterium]
MDYEREPTGDGLTPPSIVQYGFVRGLEPVTYVEVILERFEHYRQFVHENPDRAG